MPVDRIEFMITPPRRSYAIVAVCLSFVRSVCLSVCLSVSRITHERVYGCRPNITW